MKAKIKFEDYKKIENAKICKYVLEKSNLLHLIEEFGTLKEVKKQRDIQKEKFEDIEFFDNEKDFKKFCKYYSIKPRFDVYLVKEKTEFMSQSRKWGNYNPI